MTDQPELTVASLAAAMADFEAERARERRTIICHRDNEAMVKAALAKLQLEMFSDLNIEVQANPFIARDRVIVTRLGQPLTIHADFTPHWAD